MSTYARYNYRVGWEANKIGKGWHLVTNEKILRSPAVFISTSPSME